MAVEPPAAAVSFPPVYPLKLQAEIYLSFFKWPNIWPSKEKAMNTSQTDCYIATPRGQLQSGEPMLRGKRVPTGHTCCVYLKSDVKFPNRHNDFLLFLKYTSGK